MEVQILEHIEKLERYASYANSLDSYNDGYKKALLNTKTFILEEIDKRDKTGYYKK